VASGHSAIDRAPEEATKRQLPRNLSVLALSLNAQFADMHQHVTKPQIPRYGIGFIVLQPPTMRKLLLGLVLATALLTPAAANGQLLIDTSFTPSEMVAEVLLGKRVKVRNVRYAGSKLALSAFRDTSLTPLIGEGIMLSTGKVFDAKGPNKRANTTYSLGTRGDHALEHIAKGMTFDAAWLEFDFQPEMETVVFNFVFGSEEYTEYVNSQFNDVFAFFISGPGYRGAKNLAVVPKTNAPITVNTVNHISNRSNYIDNNPYDRLGNLRKEKYAGLYPDLVRNYEYDGFTTLLSVEARVRPGEVYHIKISIADVSDGRYDSAVFLEGHSFTSLPQDPTKRQEILAEEYGDVKRKFRPVKVGEDPKAKPGEQVAEGGNVVGDDWAFMVNFDFDEAALSPVEKARLDSAWTHVLSKSTKKVMVHGHTDNVGGEGYNDRLSERRAHAVLAYLKAKGLPHARIATEGFGFHKPATSNETDVGRALNRRVEVRLEE
jgi:outer membrane protein OmpA-like peptidoglycan-associated protein